MNEAVAMIALFSIGPWVVAMLCMWVSTIRRAAEAAVTEDRWVVPPKETRRVKIRARYAGRGKVV